MSNKLNARKRNILNYIVHLNRKNSGIDVKAIENYEVKHDLNEKNSLNIQIPHLSTKVEKYLFVRFEVMEAMKFFIVRLLRPNFQYVDQNIYYKNIIVKLKFEYYMIVLKFLDRSDINFKMAFC